MDDFLVKIKKLRNEVDGLYIYGAGLYGRTMYQMLARNKIKVDGFTVTICKEGENVLGVPVFGIQDIINRKVGIVLGLNKFNTIEVLDYLEQNKFDMKYVLYRKEFVRNAGDECILNKNPMMEITTGIGCKVNCYYCPQKLLLDNYFKTDKKRKVMMELEDFKKCLDKLPLNCDILFCGMSEPLLNVNCIEMMKLACETGRTVELFTTLVGADMKDVEKICNLPLNLVTLHVADKFGHAKIPVSEEYYNMVEKMINSKREDGAPLVNVCSSQEDADDRIKEICEGKCEIVTALHDRAGNLQGNNLMTQERVRGRISCSNCGQGMNRNVLLPDGTVILCCMDYGIKHPLGNLLMETYDDIMSGKEMQRIRQGINGDESADILCRHCSQAHEIR
nr:SPASM domain-containing protein [uncultured Acetatifactor sp.]